MNEDYQREAESWYKRHKRHNGRDYIYSDDKNYTMCELPQPVAASPQGL